MASTRSISKSDEYKLWREAGSRCSICREEIFKFERNGMLGEMAHIVAASEDGPRGNSELSSEERDSYQNLILLCPNHHSIIDNDKTTWTVEKLHKMKKAHEEWVDIQLSKGTPWLSNIMGGTLCYINIPRLSLSPGASIIQHHINQSILSGEQSLHELGIELAHVLLLTEEILKGWNPPTLDLDDISSENIGATIKFDTEFMSKNIPAPYKLSSFKMKGNISKDPHIHCKVRERKVYFTINPRWITTMTAFGLLRERRILFSGLGVLTLARTNEAFITPLVIGQPKSAYGWDF